MGGTPAQGSYLALARSEQSGEPARVDRASSRAKLVGQKHQDAVDAAVIDEFAAKSDRVHNASNLDCGVTLWNARPKPAPSAAYWPPLPDPEPRESRE